MIMMSGTTGGRPRCHGPVRRRWKCVCRRHDLSVRRGRRCDGNDGNCRLHCFCRSFCEGGAQVDKSWATASLLTSTPLRTPAVDLRYIFRQCHKFRPELLLAPNQIQSASQSAPFSVFVGENSNCIGVPFRGTPSFWRLIVRSRIFRIDGVDFHHFAISMRSTLGRTWSKHSTTMPKSAA